MKGAFRAPVLLVATAALMTACSTESEPPGPPARIAAVSDRTGDAITGAELEDSLVVRVFDANDRAVPGAEVSWGAQGGGSVSPSVSLTDSKGRARTSWTLGTRTGPQLAMAQVLTVDGPQDVIFTYDAAPGAATSLRVTPEVTFLLAGETRQLAAVATDRFGNAFAGRSATWSTSSAAVATVSQSGLVTAVGPGTAEITVRSEERIETARVTVAAGRAAEDLFNTSTPGLYTQYADVQAQWVIANGVLTASGAGKQSHFVRNDVSFRDGWVEAEMDRADEGGLVLRFRDSGTLYLLAIRDDGSVLGFRNLELFRRVNGQFELLEFGKNITWPRGSIRTVRFEAVGSRLRGYVNGELVIEATDAAITGAGAAGMRFHDVPEDDPTTDQARYLTLRMAWQ